MFLTALCTHVGVVSGDRVMSGDRGAESVGEEFPEGPVFDPEVIAGPQPGALGFRADAPDVSGGGGRPAQAMEAFMESAPPAFERVLGTPSRERRGAHLPTRRP